MKKQEIIRLRNQFYGYFSDVFIEFIKANSLKQKDLIERVELINFEEPESYLKENQSIIFVTGHQGNWEWAIQRLGITGYRYEVIYQKLQNKGFNDFTIETRTKFGEVIMIEREDAIRKISESNKTRAICLLSDQSPRKINSAYWLEFLNQDTAFTKGMEKFANNLNLPVFYIELIRKSRGQYAMRFELLTKDPNSIKEEGKLTEKFAKNLEKSIINYKDQYLWSHKRWKLKRNQ